MLEATKVKEYKSIKPKKFYWLANLKDCRAVGSCFVTMFSEGSWTFCSLTSLCSRRRRLRNINLENQINSTGLLISKIAGQLAPVS